MFWKQGSLIPQKSSLMGPISRQLLIIISTKTVVIDQKAKFMSEQLEIEINLDRRNTQKVLKPAKKGEAKT